MIGARRPPNQTILQHDAGETGHAHVEHQTMSPVQRIAVGQNIQRGGEAAHRQTERLDEQTNR